MRLSGQVVLLTGADSPLVGEIGAALAAEGARIVFAAATEAAASAAAKACGHNALGIGLQVADETSWVAAMKVIQARCGRIDGFVSGPAPVARGRLQDWSLADWRAYEDKHLLGPWLGMRTCISAMRQIKGGSIVLLSSILARRVQGELPANAAVAAGLQTMAQAAALECGQASDGIRINSVLLDPLAPVAAADVAAALIYFLSGESSFATASELVIDGAAALAGAV